MKSEIIARLGQTDILVPSLIAEGLAANDRVKTRLSVLQAASRHARDPGCAKFELTEECRAAGLDTMAMELLVNRARLLAGELVMAPPRQPRKRDLGRGGDHDPSCRSRRQSRGRGGARTPFRD